MINLQNINPIYIFIVVLIFGIILFSGVGMAEDTTQNNYEVNQFNFYNNILSTINDGYLYDEQHTYDRDAVRIVDFELAATEVPAKSAVESQIIIANYGPNDIEDVILKPYITEVESENEIDDEDYKLEPKPRYEDIDLESGEHKTYEFKFTFYEENMDYNIGFIQADVPTDRPMAQKMVSIQNEFTGTSESLLLDRDRLTIDQISVTRYKDEHVTKSSSPGASLSIPPIEKDSDGNVYPDVAKGTISDFGNMRSDSNRYGEIRSEDGEINVGFSSENIPNDNHYAISLLYDLEDIDSAELNILTSSGEEVDENSSYYISSSTPDKEERIFQLSNKEIEYLQSQSEIYFTYDNIDAPQNEIEIHIYEMKVIALNDVWNLPNEELDIQNLKATDSEGIELDMANSGEHVYIHADIENTGSISVNEEFRLYEIQASGSNTTVDISESIIINPGETESVTYRIPISRETTHEFSLLGETIVLGVEEGDSGAIQQSISIDDSTIGVGETMEFNAGDLTDEELDSIESVEWRFKDDSDYISADPEETVSHTYTEPGTHTVTLKTEYTDENGETQIHRTTTTVQIMDGPDVEIGSTQYNFNIDDQELRGVSSGSSASGQMLAGTCPENCRGSFTFDGLNLAISQGINMLVLETERDGYQYNPIHYGTYDVKDDKFATTNTVSSDGMTAIRDTMSDGGNDGASQGLINDIDIYSGEDRYFIFVSGGNPSPELQSNEVFNELNNLGATLSDSNNLEENSMWTFATQTLSNGDVTPLHESYIPKESDLPSISHEYSIEPALITDENDAIPNRPVHYDLDSTDTVESLSDANIDWTLNDGTTINNEIYVSEIYTGENNEYTVNAIVEEDTSGLSDASEHTITTNTMNPVASIPDDLRLSVDESGLIYTLNSMDSDSTIVNYDWSIPELNEEGVVEDTIEYNTRNVLHTFDYADSYNVDLTVEDRYGNTDTTTKEIQVFGSPPNTDAEIRRVLSDYNAKDRININNIVSNQPILYYPLDFSEGITEEYARSLDGVEDGSIVSVDGVSDASSALRFDGQSSIDVPRKANNPISEQIAVSTWIKTNSDGTIYDTSNDAHSVTIQNSNEDSDFKIETGDDMIGLDFNADISSDEWTHIVASYDIIEGMKLYVDGELDNTNARDVGELDLDDSNTKIGSQTTDENYFVGDISNLQIYDMRLNEDDVTDIYENNADSLVNVNYQGVFYDFGEEYKTIYDSTKSDGDGVVDRREDHINIIADSRISGVDSEQYIELQNIDYSQYESIHISYDAEFYKERASGDSVTGSIGIEADGEKSEYIVYNHMNSYSNGILEIDVSDIEDTTTLYINAKSYGENLGRTNVEIYDIWGETENVDNPSVTNFYDEVYPHIISNVNSHETREGIKFSQKDIQAQRDISTIGDIGTQYNIMPADSALSLTTQYDVHTSSSSNGLHLYGDQSGSYSLQSGAVSSDAIYCDSSSLLQEDCNNTGDSSDTTQINNGPYSDSSIETSMLTGHSVIDTLRVNAETQSTMYPTVHFDGSISTGSGAGIHIKEYEWDLSTDTVFRADYVGEQFTHEFNEIGTHEVALRTTDTFGEQSTETFSFEVSNLAPSITTQFTTQGELGESISYSVNARSNGEAEIEQIMWDMGDGNVEFGDTVEYEYLTAGDYDVTVIAIDEAGLTTSDTRTVNIGGSSPDLDSITTAKDAHVRDTILFDTTGDAEFENVPLGAQNRVDLSAAEDPNGGELRFDWLFPFNGVDRTGLIFNEDEPSTIITDVDDKTFEVTAQNNERRETTEQIDISVYNDGPSLDMNIDTPIEVDEDRELDGQTYVSEPVEIDLNAYHNHPRVGAELRINIDDGTTETVSIPADEGASYTYTFEHQFDVTPEEYDKDDFPIEFDISAEIEDEFGVIVEDNFSIEVLHRGVDIEDAYSTNENGVRTTELEAGEPIDYIVDADAPDVDDENLEYRFEFSSGDDSGWQSSNEYEYQWTIVGEQNVDITVRESTYGFADSASVLADIQVRESCRRIQQNNEDPDSGLYYVVPEGFDEPVEVLCDMDYDGGGWTLVLAADGPDSTDDYISRHGSPRAGNNWNTNQQFATPNANFGELQQPQYEGWKLSDDMIDRIQFDGEGILRATTLDLEQSSNNYQWTRFFEAATYKHATSVTDRSASEVGVSYADQEFTDRIQGDSNPHHSVKGLADDHYPPTGDGYLTNHCHTTCYVESDTAIWVK